MNSIDLLNKLIDDADEEYRQKVTNMKAEELTGYEQEKE